MDFDGLHGRDRNNLAAAELDLNDAAATEHLFDRRLRRIALPPAIEEVARALIRVNEARANLTTTAASATTIRQLRNQEPGVTAADEPVEQLVKNIRCQLGLPPPDSN
jgi:hypothetical protein